MASNKQGKMAGYINYRMRITLNDGRQMTGQMLAFDKHMNLVLADTEEFRRIRRKQTKPAAAGASGTASGQTTTIEQEEKRTLGLIIVRGAQIVSLSVESPPPADPSARLGKAPTTGVATGLTAGPGLARPAGRGAPAPISLAGPAAGVGSGQPFPPGFPGAPGFGRGGPPPGFPTGGFPAPGFPGAPGGFAPPGFPPGGPPPPGFNPPPRR
ncbi:small nuclear ribonucleoprotein [Niveomyces insectorum RCEF 264]|uniref:Sm protein B n=1 Tax=Niveomyces insectorum RCEF 264 TaxID=1081102 RepID=A0A167Z2C4_9HYPO|nr:small nuclear ribonucleoprotein [Niveomyces insectorum RCEF 264]